jgi:alkylhydroperoxidase/carboxymuconolactone decarboxylase family protein YurZ
MSSLPPPPDTYRAFVQRYPRIAEAWEAIGAAGKEGPLAEKTARLIKLAVACAALREGAVHANVRKALAVGISREEIEQVIALAAGTLGLPATVAVFSWVEEALGAT